MITCKANVICILEILKEHSDEEHILSMGEITKKMKSIYDLSVERRTVYAAVDTLKLLGYDISAHEENKKGYYLRERDFELSEIKLLMDRVYSTSFISAKQTTELIEKLQLMISVHQRKKYKHLRAARQSKKTQNPQIFLNVELLDEAIDKKVKIKFNYCKHNLDKKLILSRDIEYIINPYQMVCANEKYYLVCNHDNYEKISHYRIDFIRDIKLLDEKVKPLPKEFDLTGYSNNLTYMFGGENENIEIICDKSMINEVIDRFGKDVKTIKIDEDHFKLLLTAPPQGIKYWALQYLAYCEVIKPVSLRDGIIEIVKGNRYLAD